MKSFYLVICSLSLIALLFVFNQNLHADGAPGIAFSDQGQGEALVLIHAFPTSQELWTPQVDALKNNFRVITIDLWGFGQSSPTHGQAVSMEAYADDLKDLLDRLKISKAIIGGESMGGYVALAFYAKYPAQVKGLVLSNTQAIADSDEAKLAREKTAQEVLKQGTASLISGFMSKALSENASEQTRRFLQKIVEAQKPEGIASALRGMAQRHDQSSLLASSTRPVLIITGAQDQVISPAQSEVMHQLVPDSKLVIIPNAGHLSNLENPQAWNRAVLEWAQE